MSQKTVFAKLLSGFVLLAMLFSSFGMSVASAGGPGTTDGETAAPSVSRLDADKSMRFIVQLKDAPLAQYKGGIRGIRATSPTVTGADKLDVTSADAQAYVDYLVRQQETLKSEVLRSVPGAVIDRQYQVVVNGISVRATGKDFKALAKLPGVVSVTPEKEYTVQMDASLPLVGLGAGTLDDTWVDAGLWETLGGHANAGAGMKIADIDSGITPDNPCFDGTDYSMPVGFPRGNADGLTVANGKIIAAYGYFRDFDPPVLGETVVDDPMEYSGGHGTHTAGTMVCNYGTDAGLAKISGVAPAAQLMVYRVFYYSESGSTSAWTPELIAAIEQAVIDGADVVNNSWGGSNINAVDDPEVRAYEAAVDAGVVVIFSAGNNAAGSPFAGGHTIGNPGGNSDKFITVGATDTGRVFANSLGINSPLPTTPADLAPMAAVPSTTTSLVADFTGDLAYYGANALACNAFPADTFAGKVAVVFRGSCTFTVKATNAYNAGAVGVVIVNNVDGAPLTASTAGSPALPIFVVEKTKGEQLRDFVIASGATPVNVTVTASLAAFTYPNAVDTVGSFSSRGPSADYKLKPDISAPGVNILSSVSPSESNLVPTFELYQGTSMSAPHVTAAAALVKQAHPDWTPAQIKSALMTTAAEPEALGTNPANYGSGRLDLTAPDKVAVTLDTPSLSYGLLDTNTTKSIKIMLRNVTDAMVTYNVAKVESAGGSVILGPSPVVSVPAHGVVALYVTAYTGATTGAKYGKIVFTPSDASPILHVPYYMHVVDDPAVDVFLIDADNSDIGGVDYSGEYMDMLDSLGVTYQYYEVTYPSFYIPFSLAYNDGKVLYFTGDYGQALVGGAWRGPLTANKAEMRDYLAQGGRMLATGHDIAWNDEWGGSDRDLGTNPLFSLIFGSTGAQDDMFEDTGIPVPSAYGVADTAPYLADVTVDFADFYGGLAPWEGAGNQQYIDELVAMEWSDVDAWPILAAPEGFGAYTGGVGSRMSSEPTIERVKSDKTAPGSIWTKLPYRTQLLSFGLEGVNNNPDTTSREVLLDRLFAWLDDEITVSFNADEYQVVDAAEPIWMGASANASFIDEPTTTGYTNQIVGYRWDFGDGSDIVETTEPWVTHLYPSNGTYEAYVEVVDTFGHKAVSSVNVVYPDYLPSGGQKAMTVRPTFDWPDTPFAKYYQIQLSKTPKFSTLVYSKILPGKVSAFKYPANLPLNTAFYWRVRSYVAGKWQPWSLPQNFISANPPSAPALLKPANGARLTSYEAFLDWKDSVVPVTTYFSHYEVEVATDAAFTNTVDYAWLFDVTESQYLTISLDPNTTYYWRVRSVNTDWQYSNWSVRKFITAY